MGTDTTLSAAINMDDSSVKKLPSSFRNATSAAKEFEGQVAKSGKALSGMGGGGGSGGGGSKFFSRGTRGMGLAGLSAAGQLGAEAFRGDATGSSIGAQAGLAAGIATAMLPGIGPILSSVLTPLFGELGRMIGATFEKFTATDTRGFSAGEAGAAARLDSERRDGGDLTDIQTKMDQFIVEAAKTRVATEDNGKYLRDLHAQGRLTQAELSKALARLGISSDILNVERAEKYAAGLVGEGVYP